MTVERFGYALLWEGHSIRARVPRFFQGRLADLNIGTADGQSCHPRYLEAVHSYAALSPYIIAVNERFKGGYITRHYGDGQRIHALQMEIAQINYMEERAPFTYNKQKAQPLKKLLKKLLSRYHQTEVIDNSV